MLSLSLSLSKELKFDGQDEKQRENDDVGLQVWGEAK